MALPDSGNVEDYSQEEMEQLLKQFAEDKTQLSKPQKAAVARYNFKKSKGEPITFRGEGAPAPAPAAAPAAKPAAVGAGADVISLLPPELQELAKKDPKDLSKEERIALAKGKAQAMKAQMAAKAGAEPAEKKKSPEEVQQEKWSKEAREKFPWIEELKKQFPNAIEDYSMQGDKPYVFIRPGAVRDVLRYARDRMGFAYLACLTAADYPPDRLEVVYNLYSYEHGRHLAAKAKLAREEVASMPSVEPLWRGADWFEREVYDMFGIRFDGHPDMRRLMMPEGWTGYPLRKDYDVTRAQYVSIDEHGNDVVSYKEEEGW